MSKTINITNLTPINTPLKPGLQLRKSSKYGVRAFNKQGLNYRSIIGALNYISTNTRPNITFVISHLSQLVEHPSFNHWIASLKVLCYLHNIKGIYPQLLQEVER
ncbi:hypothetical protein O181_041097 [Austropuccinia psidii MF-1]|uniref:Uncharacterized protein n=1 Tax=Austropuccinia psidii MF-1 TaxID=1389203 RepID=A0A9Q3DG32_9BASI|nr:hypothetical protein [Austropuccinia psidii MF-1]